MLLKTQVYDPKTQNPARPLVPIALTWHTSSGWRRGGLIRPPVHA